MRGNVLGPIDKTVNVLIDRSYPVIKEVYLRLKELLRVYESIEAVDWVSTNRDELHNLQEAADNLQRIYQSIDKVDEVQNKIEIVEAVAANLENIQVTVDNLQPILEAADIAEDIRSSVSEHIAIKEEIVLLTNEAKQAAATAQEVLAQAKDAIAEAGSTEIEKIQNEGSTQVDLVVDTANQKKSELLKIAGTYFEPHVSEEGDLSWTNTGDRENPAVVNIKGPKGDTGTGLDIVGQVASYDELVTNHPIGNPSDIYQTEDTGEIWLWDSEKNCWVNLGHIQGAKGDPGEPGLSANEILMDPDPVAYFDEIYGKTDLITGDLVTDVSGTDPDAVEIFEEELN